MTNNLVVYDSNPSKTINNAKQRLWVSCEPLTNGILFVTPEKSRMRISPTSFLGTKLGDGTLAALTRHVDDFAETSAEETYASTLSQSWACLRPSVMKFFMEE